MDMLLFYPLVFGQNFWILKEFYVVLDIEAYSSFQWGFYFPESTFRMGPCMSRLPLLLLMLLLVLLLLHLSRLLLKNLEPN